MGRGAKGAAQGTVCYTLSVRVAAGEVVIRAAWESTRSKPQTIAHYIPHSTFSLKVHFTIPYYFLIIYQIMQYTVFALFTILRRGISHKLVFKEQLLFSFHNNIKLVLNYNFYQIIANNQRELEGGGGEGKVAICIPLKGN
jgi:hypothetical protein